MALTIIEAAKINSGDVISTAIVELYAQNSDILLNLPIKDIVGNAYKYNIEDALPGIGFRGINESFDEGTGVLNPQTEVLTIAGGDLDVDTFIVKTQGASQRGVHEAMKVKHLAHKFTEKFIKGDSEASQKEFDGLQKRLGGNQLIAAGSTSGGDALSLEKLDELIDAVDSPTHLYMTKTMRRKLTVAARDTSVGGFISYTIDAFGRRIENYNDLPILLADRNGTQGAGLAFNEANPGGGSNVGTSIYALELREGRLSGMQNGGMDVRDLGELETAPKYRTRVEWFVGLLLEFPRAAARLYGIKNASVVK